MDEQHMNTTEDLFEVKKSGGFGLSGLVAVLVLAAAVVFSALLWTQKNKVGTRLDNANAQIENIQIEMSNIQKKENISDQLAAATILKKVEEREVEWSQLVTALQRIETADVRFTAYSGNRDQKVFVTGRAPRYDLVADLIETIEKEPTLNAQFAESIVETRANRSGSRPSLGAVEPEKDVQFQLVFDYADGAKSVTETKE